MTGADRDGLPIPDYDHLPIAVLRQRMHPLGQEQLQDVIDYETAHNDRPLIQQLLRHRMDELQSGAEPSDGPTGGGVPQTPDNAAAAAASDPTVDSPAINPPSQGDPTNPAQPR